MKIERIKTNPTELFCFHPELFSCKGLSDFPYYKQMNEKGSFTNKEEWYILSDDGVVNSMMAIKIVSENHIFIKFLESRIRNKGYASELIRFVIKTNTGEISLQSKTRQLVPFYERLGFSEDTNNDESSPIMMNYFNRK